MGLSVEDRILIKNLYFAKGYGAVRLNLLLKDGKKHVERLYEAFETNFKTFMLSIQFVSNA